MQKHLRNFLTTIFKQPLTLIPLNRYFCSPNLHFINTRCIRLLIPLFALFLSGCNNDIFIDDAAPSDRDFTIHAGEGKEITYSTDFLRSIRLELSSFEYDWTIYADYGYSNTYDGRSWLYIMDKSSSLPAVTRATAVTDLIQVEYLQPAEGKLKINLLGNTSGENITGRIVLTYSYKEEIIGFTLMREETKGAYIVSGLTYGEEFRDEFSDIKRTLMTVNNNSDKTITQSLCPADYCDIRVMFETPALKNFMLDPEEAFPEVEIPTFLSSGTDGVISGALHGIKAVYSTDQVILKPLDSGLINDKSFYTSYPVEIAPHSAAAAEISLSYIIITANATLHICNSTTGERHDLPTTVRVIQPFFYNFIWKDVPVDIQ